MGPPPDQIERLVQRLPVIGQNFTHSAFEAVQQAAIEAAGLPLRIERWERRPHQLAAAIDELGGEEFVGALIAQPHKEKAAGLVPTLSEDARHTGAVNVIVRDGTGRLRGHNSDVDGLRAGITALLPSAQGTWPRHAVVLGAGGGARAAVSVLMAAGMQRVAVFNRHLHRAESLVAHFARGARQMDLRAMPWHETILEAELAKTGLLVNASGIGQEGDEAIALQLVPEGIYLLDLEISRASTPLMDHVRSRGGTAANGQHSFLASSTVTFQLLTGQDAPAEVMRAALADALGMPEGAALVGD